MPSHGDRIVALARLAHSRVLPGPEKNVGAQIGDRMDTVADLVSAGEFGVAFEILSENLLDYDIRLSANDFAELSSLADAMGVDRERFVTPLRDLIVSDARGQNRHG